MHLRTIQAFVALGLTILIAVATWAACHHARSRTAETNTNAENKEFFLAGRGLPWYFVAGSITITNLSTDQLVGMNGNQMALLSLWELSAVAGLSILTWVFLPIYYRNNCTTVTELLQIKLGSKAVRAVIAAIFLVGNIVIYQPIMLYTGALMMKSLFGLETPIIVLAAGFAAAGAVYAIFGGLRAVSVTDTYSGVLLLGMGSLVVFLSLRAIHFDVSGIPKERLSLIGGPQSPIPWPTLLTGMIFIQMFYWSTNQTITQRAMAAPTLREAQKGVFAATVVRLLIIPAMVVIPGIVSYKLFGRLGDAAYGRIVWTVMPNGLSGVFAAAIASAVLAHFASSLNASAGLFVCDIYETHVNPRPDVARLSTLSNLAFVVLAVLLVPIYDGADSIINLVQKLNGLTSMPVLSVFIVCLLFKNVEPRAALVGLVFGVLLYGYFSFVWAPLHYIHMMFITLWSCVALSLAVNRLVFGRTAQLSWTPALGLRRARPEPLHG